MEIIRRKACAPFVAQDGAVVREIVSPRNSSAKNQSLAEVTIPPGTTIQEHYHEKAEEIYYIVSGEGLMTIDGEQTTVSAQDAVIILPGQRHKIGNSGTEDLVMIVNCAPSYSDEDQILV